MKDWFVLGGSGFNCLHCKDPQIALGRDAPLPPYIPPQHYVFQFLVVPFTQYDYFNNLYLHWEQPPSGMGRISAT